MALSKDKIKRMKDLIYGVYDRLDPSGINTTNIKKQLDPMSDAQFEKWVKTILSDKSFNFKLNIQPYKNDLTIENIRKAADFMKVPLFERVSMPYIDANGEVVQTQYEVPVGYVHVKRLQQMVAKKNSMSIHSEKRSSLTGQVTAHDKNSRVSDMENIALVTLDNDELLKEFLSAKSDDMLMKTEMLRQIKNDGFVDISNIPSSPKNKTAINTMDVYFTSVGIKTDLITDGLLLKRTLNNLNKDVKTLSSEYKKENL